MKKNQQIVRCVHTPKQKLCGVLGLLAVFVCGVMTGRAIVSNSEQKNVAPVCDCPQAVPCECPTVADVAVADAVKPACAIIEEIQSNWLYPENSDDVHDHEINVHIYETLFKHGCPENADKYRVAIAREMEILESFGERYSGAASNDSTCEQIEASLLDRLPSGGTHANEEQRIGRAQIYANLSERGCPENSEKYVALAKQELEIARALTDDKFEEDETIEIVETYKRLNMQAAAEEIFDVAKKITNPAIDFILEVEKIINEKQ